MAGYRLHFTGVACAAVLGCGPEVGKDGAEGEGSSGYSLSGITGVDPDDSSAETIARPECNSGEICGEYSVCQCSCDADPFCCACGPVACTEDAQCPSGNKCLLTGGGSLNSWDYDCFPAVCAEGNTPSSRFDETSPPDLSTSAACVGTLVIENTQWEDFSRLPNLQFIGSGGRIQNNDLLDVDVITAWLAEIEGGDSVEVCGNLGDVACEDEKG